MLQAKNSTGRIFIVHICKYFVLPPVYIFQLYTDTFSRNIERMLRQHSSMWSLLETHARTLAVLSTEAGVSPPDLSALASHSSQRATTPTTSTKDGDDTTHNDVSKRNLTSNALVSQSGELA